MRATTEATAKHQSIFDDAMERGKQVTESTRTPIEAYESTIADLNSLLSVGAINQETYNRAVDAAGDSFDKASNKGNDFAATQQGIIDNAMRSLQTSLADFLFDPFDEGLDGMLNGFVNIIRKMGAEMLAANIMQSLFAQDITAGGAGGAGGGLFAGLAGMFSFAGGGSTGSGPRSGGIDGKGGFMAVMHPQEEVIDHRGGQGGGGANVTMYVTTPDADSFRASRRQVGNAVKRGIGG
jgi:hypothetical protein